MHEILTIIVSDDGEVQALASAGCRWLTKDKRGFSVDVGGCRVNLDRLGSLEGRDRLLPLARNPRLYGPAEYQ